MKVLHLIDSGGLYGAEKMLLALVKAQMDQGLDPMILSAGDPAIEEKPLEAEAKRLELPITPWRMKPGFNIRESRKILKWAISNGYHILHSHGFKFNVLLGSYPKRLRGIPMVATLHGYVHARKFSKMWLYELLDRFAITFLQSVVLVGEAMKKDLPDSVTAREKVRVIPNGLDIDAISQQSKLPVEWPIQEFMSNHSPIILGVGRLSKEKGFDRLVAAFASLKRCLPTAGMVIVGEGKQRSSLEFLLQQHGISDSVLMPGYSNNVASLLRKVDLLVMPSLTEGLPITLLEAMAIETPVLVSSVGEMPSVLGFGRGGNIVETRADSVLLARAITDALNCETLTQKTEWAAKAVLEKFSSESMAKQYLELYRGL